LHEAPPRWELDVRYLIVTYLTDRRVISAEALLRWRRRGLGLIEPERFLPIAEDNGLIGPITKWVVHRVCRDAKELGDTLDRHDQHRAMLAER
jgi:sensor c-di-GMP phosphodiesterase-like protein